MATKLEHCAVVAIDVIGKAAIILVMGLILTVIGASIYGSVAIRLTIN